MSFRRETRLREHGPEYGKQPLVCRRTILETPARLFSVLSSMLPGIIALYYLSKRPYSEQILINLGPCPKVSGMLDKTSIVLIVQAIAAFGSINTIL